MFKTSSLKKLQKQNLLKIKFDGEDYLLDLGKELQISETKINSLIADNPANYGLLLQAKSTAVAKRDQLEREKDKIFSQIYISVVDSNPKATKEYATHKANANTKYQVANDKFLKAKEYADRLISVCKALEMKAQLLQTFSSNIRKE